MTLLEAILTEGRNFLQETDSDFQGVFLSENRYQRQKVGAGS